MTTAERPPIPTPDTFAGAGVVAHFRGPYADGPPPEALRIEAPPLDRFGRRELARMITIGWVLFVMVLRAGARRLFKPGSGPWAGALANGMVDAFEVLGPTFVKLGQMIASSPGIFPAPMADACLRCLDEVPPFPATAVKAQIEADLGRGPHSLFTAFDDQPLSAASIAQVHACTLPDGRTAVIKLQRPNIAERMNTDLRIMYRFAKLIAKTKLGAQMNAAAVIEDLHQVTNEELNFVLEAHRQTRFRDRIGAFGDNKWITAPEVYWDYCGQHMICMERMSGTPMDEFAALQAQGIDGELVLRRGVKVWFEAAMIHGPFHGDVHAGNLWVLDDGRSTYLDFGIMGELTEDWKQILKDMQYTAMIDGDYTRIVRNWKRVGVMPTDIGPDEVIAAQIKLVMDPLLDQAIGEVSLGELMKQNLEMANQFGATAPRELVLITKQLLYFERYAKALAPDYNMARDIYLLKNIFPEEVAKRAAELGVELPD